MEGQGGHQVGRDAAAAVRCAAWMPAPDPPLASPCAWNRPGGCQEPLNIKREEAVGSGLVGRRGGHRSILNPHPEPSAQVVGGIDKERERESPGPSPPAPSPQPPAPSPQKELYSGDRNALGPSNAEAPSPRPLSSKRNFTRGGVLTRSDWQNDTTSPRFQSMWLLHSAHVCESVCPGPH